MESIQKSASEGHWERQDSAWMLMVLVILRFAVRLSGLDQLGLARKK